MATGTFCLQSSATPEQVWSALTCPTLSPRFLHGFSAQGCWETDGQLRFTSALGLELSGHVLWSEPPHKLSLTIEDEGSGTCTYLTWQLRASSCGTVVRLCVEECDAAPSDAEELEDSWLPALAGLESVLQDSRGTAL